MHHPIRCDCPLCTDQQKQFDAFLVAVLFLIFVLVVTHN